MAGETSGRASLASPTAKTRALVALRRNRFLACTKSGHPPVDHLHSIENKIDKVAHFSLTQAIEGVQQDRSLTVS
jgi:hypothetical protein